MADVVSVDQFLDGWYPGWKPEHLDNPWLRMKSVPFTKQDEERFWFVDFHWPRGFSPLGMQFVSRRLVVDAARRPPTAAASRRRARAAHGRAVPLRGRGAGHVAVGDRLPGRADREEHAQVPAELRRHLGRAQVGARARAELLRELRLRRQVARPISVSTCTTPGRFQKRAWEIHFEIMYPLLAIYLQLYGVCASNGIDPGNIAKMLQGREHKITETDRAMWDLADEAKRLGIGDIFADNEAADIRGALAAGGRQRLGVAHQVRRLPLGLRPPHRGHRRHEHPVVDRGQTSPLGQLANFVAAEERHDFDAGTRRRRRPSATRSSSRRGRQLSGEALGAFNELLAINQVANFAWWNEEHNYYIDLRATIPMRDGALAIGRRGRRRHVRRRPVPVLLRTAGRLRGARQVGRPAVDGHRAPRLLRRLPETSARRCRRSSARCRRRSRTRC